MCNTKNMGEEEKRGRGRPATGHDPTLSIRMPVALRERMDAVLEEGETRADLIRAAVEREISRRLASRYQRQT